MWGPLNSQRTLSPARMVTSPRKKRSSSAARGVPFGVSGRARVDDLRRGLCRDREGERREDGENGGAAHGPWRSYPRPAGGLASGAMIGLAIRFYDVVLWLHISSVVIGLGVLFAYP